jgi:hypothetical protein
LNKKKFLFWEFLLLISTRIRLFIKNLSNKLSLSLSLSLTLTSRHKNSNSSFQDSNSDSSINNSSFFFQGIQNPIIYGRSFSALSKVLSQIYFSFIKKNYFKFSFNYLLLLLLLLFWLKVLFRCRVVFCDRIQWIIVSELIRGVS